MDGSNVTLVWKCQNAMIHNAQNMRRIVHLNLIQMKYEEILSIKQQPRV